jgi:hypothetical protein
MHPHPISAELLQTLQLAWLAVVAFVMVATIMCTSIGLILLVRRKKVDTSDIPEATEDWFKKATLVRPERR